MVKKSEDLGKYRKILFSGGDKRQMSQRQFVNNGYEMTMINGLFTKLTKKKYASPKRYVNMHKQQHIVVDLALFLLA